MPDRKAVMEFQIIPYSSEHKMDFRRLNLEWLEHYNLIESHDLELLDDPQGTILDGGGAIYLAEYNGKIIGSAALVPEEDGVYELAKMAVTPEFRGNGISRMLIEKCLARAKQLKAVRVTLFSNHQLTTAIS